MKSYVNEGLRVLLHGKGIVEEDDLDKRWEEVTGEVIDEVIFFSKHTAVSNKPALTVHPIGNFCCHYLLAFFFLIVILWSSGQKSVAGNDLLGWIVCVRVHVQEFLICVKAMFHLKVGNLDGQRCQIPGSGLG